MALRPRRGGPHRPYQPRRHEQAKEDERRRHPPLRPAGAPHGEDLHLARQRGGEIHEGLAGLTLAVVDQPGVDRQRQEERARDCQRRTPLQEPAQRRRGRIALRRPGGKPPQTEQRQPRRRQQERAEEIAVERKGKGRDQPDPPAQAPRNGRALPAARQAVGRPNHARRRRLEHAQFLAVPDEHGAQRNERAGQQPRCAPAQTPRQQQHAQHGQHAQDRAQRAQRHVGVLQAEECQPLLPVVQQQVVRGRVLVVEQRKGIGPDKGGVVLRPVQAHRLVEPEGVIVQTPETHERRQRDDRNLGPPGAPPRSGAGRPVV